MKEMRDLKDSTTHDVKRMREGECQREIGRERGRQRGSHAIPLHPAFLREVKGGCFYNQDATIPLTAIAARTPDFELLLPAASEQVALYVLWGARCREARKRRDREKRPHSPFALHAPLQWAI